MANSYPYAITMICMYQRKNNVISSLESLVLSYLYNSLYIADYANGVTSQHICLKLNLLKNNSTNSLKLGIKTRVSLCITDMWKNIYKTALTEDRMDADIKFGNHFDFIHNSNKILCILRRIYTYN